MKRISIFYHCYMSCVEIPTSWDNCLRIAATQLDALNCCGLTENAAKIFVGVNGTESDHCAIAAMCPEKAEVHHNKEGVAELPTMRQMQLWCAANPGHHVLYFHTKGAIHNGNPSYEAWRNCMEGVCLWRWRECVHKLDNGRDSVGAHWLTPEELPFIGKTAYWGGNFWWATSDFINTLPQIDVNLNRYEAEVWIGRGPKRPSIHDFKHHFPMQGCL